MKHLHLLVSDLLLPQEIAPQMFRELPLPALEKLLARSVQSVLPATTIEDSICAHFEAGSVAPVRATADGLDAGQGFWMCADPVNLQLQQSQVLLQPNVQCDAAEAAALCITLNEHFKQDGLTFFAPHPQRWYVHSDTTYSVALTPLRVAMGRDVKPFQAQGADALVWKRLANEIQMLLHDHPINQAREAQGLSAINSVWLWGAGHKTPLHTALDVVGGDTLSAAFACVSGVPVVASLADMLEGQGQHGLWVSTGLGVAMQCEDLYAWREQIQVLEHEIAQPVWQALRAGHLQTVTLDVSLESETRSFTLNRAGIWKVWRRAKTLAAYGV